MNSALIKISHTPNSNALSYETTKITISKPGETISQTNTSQKSRKRTEKVPTSYEHTWQTPTLWLKKKRLTYKRYWGVSGVQVLPAQHLIEDWSLVVVLATTTSTTSTDAAHHQTGLRRSENGKSLSVRSACWYHWSQWVQIYPRILHM